MTVIPLENVTRGVCEWLDAQGFAVFRPDTPYVAGERAVTFRALPKAPVEAVSVNLYGVDDDLTLPSTTVSVQLRFRASSEATVNVWADQVASSLHMRHGLKMGDLVVQRAVRTIVAPLGVDENGRVERADSYDLLLMRSPTL